LNLGEPAPVAGPSGLGTSAATANNDPWSPVGSTPTQNVDPWSPVKKPEIDPLESLLGSGPTNGTNFSQDPWAPAPPTSVPIATSLAAQNDPWAAFEGSAVATPGTPGSNNGIMNGSNGTNGAPAQRTGVKTPESFLGENSSLVNLDNLMGPPAAQNKTASNPFIVGTTLGANTSSTNPFNAQQRPSPSLNEMMQAQRTGSSLGASSTQQQNASTNPFAL